MPAQPQAREVQEVFFNFNFFMCFMVKFQESVTLGDAKLRYERNLNIFTMKDMPAQPQAREVREVLSSVSSCASWWKFQER